MKLVLKSVTEGIEPPDALSQLFASHANNTILTEEELKFSEGFFGLKFHKHIYTNVLWQNTVVSTQEVGKGKT